MKAQAIYLFNVLTIISLPHKRPIASEIIAYLAVNPIP